MSSCWCRVVAHGASATPLSNWYGRRVMAMVTLPEERESTVVGLFQADPTAVPRITHQALARAARSAPAHRAGCAPAPTTTRRQTRFPGVSACHPTRSRRGPTLCHQALWSPTVPDHTKEAAPGWRDSYGCMASTRRRCWAATTPGVQYTQWSQKVARPWSHNPRGAACAAGCLGLPRIVRLRPQDMQTRGPPES